MSDTSTALSPPTVDGTASDTDKTPVWRSVASTIITTVVTLLGIAVIVGVAGSALGYYRLDVVLTGSMKPIYNPGDIVFARPLPTDRLGSGDVIMFNTPDAYGGDKVTHRVVGVKMDEEGVVTVRTKGDNNDEVDPWNAVVSTENTWVVQNSIPKVGFVAQWAKSWWATLLALGVAFPMLVVARRRVLDAYAITPRHAAPRRPKKESAS